MQFKGVSYSEGELFEGTHLSDMYNISCNLLKCEHRAFFYWIQNKMVQCSNNK